jgi:hypothetical protein
MPTQGSDNAGVGAAAKQVAEHATTIAKLEIRLATLELARKGKALAIGIGLGLTAAILLLFALGFALASIAAALALAMDMWLALLIVAIGLLIIIAVLGFLAVKLLKRGAPPVPDQAIEEAKLTTEAIKEGHA